MLGQADFIMLSLVLELRYLQTIREEYNLTGVRGNLFIK